MPKEKFSNGVMVEVNPKGCMDNDMMVKWLESCYLWSGGFFSHEEINAHHVLHMHTHER